MPPIDPNQIDINLSLLPGESETAVNALITQLQAISNQLAALKSPDAHSRAAAERGMFLESGLPLHGVSSTASRPSGLAGAVDLDSHMRERESERQDEERRRLDDERERLRREQQEYMDQASRRYYAESLAQQKLHTAGVVTGARHVLRGTQPDIGTETEQFTAAEQAAAYEAVQPAGLGRGKSAINRTLQVLAPDAQPVDREALRRAAAQRAYQETAQAAQEAGEPVVVQAPPGGRSGGASAPATPAGRLGDDGFSEPSAYSTAPAHGEVPPGAPAWMRHVSQSSVYQPMTMPRIGEFTAQDTLQMMSQFLGRRAYDAQTRAGGDMSAGFLRGGASAGFARMAAMAPYVANLGGNLRRRGFETDASGLEELAILTGRGEIGATLQDRLGLPGPLGDIAGYVRDPAERIRNIAQSVALQGRFVAAGAQTPYMRSGQAVSIGSEMVRAGFGEDQATAALRQHVGHVRGETLNVMDPGAIVDVYQRSIRAGGEPMSQFVEALSTLPDAARAARMSIEEMNSASLQFAETVQSMGGTFLGGYRAAEQFSLQTGVAPQVGEALMGNELIQGLTYGATGIMPQLQGMLGQGQRTGMAVNSLSMLVDMFSAGTSTTRQNVPGGVLEVSGRDQAIALAAQTLGLDREVAERLLNQQDMINQMGPAQGSIDAYMQDIDAARQQYGNNTPEFRRAVRRFNREGGASGVSRRDIIGALEDAGFEDARERIGNASGIEIQKRVAEMQEERWRDIYGEAAEKGGAPNDDIAEQIRGQIELTPAAQQLFRLAWQNLPGNERRRLQQQGYNPNGSTEGTVPERVRDLGQVFGALFGGG